MGFQLQLAAQRDLKFRPVEESDLPLLAELYASTRREEVASTGWPAELQKAFLQQQHEAQHAHYQSTYDTTEWSIIEVAGHAAGRFYWYENETDLHIVDITLLPKYRGDGIGRALLEDFLGHARTLAKGVTIHVEKTNPARRLYSRLGFSLREDRGFYDLLGVEPAQIS